MNSFLIHFFSPVWLKSDVLISVQCISWHFKFLLQVPVMLYKELPLLILTLRQKLRTIAKVGPRIAMTISSEAR